MRDHNLSGTLKDQFEWLFIQHDWNLDNEEDSYYYTKYRIKKFVNSRNKLFHKHKFATPETVENWSREVRKEIDNIEMFIPLLLATVLQYKGEYWHRLARKNNNGSQWERMPS